MNALTLLTQTKKQYEIHQIYRWNRPRDLAPDRWQVVASCTPQATLLARHLTVEDRRVHAWSGAESRVQANCFVVNAERCPCVGLSPQTPQEVVDFLHEQGYPARHCSLEEASTYALYLNVPQGLGTTREEQVQRCSDLVQKVERIEAPFLRFGHWPDGSHAALAITGDIDSVTVQDFFLRILEVH